MNEEIYYIGRVIKDEGLVEEKFIFRNDPGSPMNICTNNRGCLPL